MVLHLGLGKKSPCLAQHFKGTHSSIFWLCPYTLGKEFVGLRGHAHLEPVPLLLDHPPGIWDPAQMAPNLPSGSTQAFLLVCFPKGSAPPVCTPLAPRLFVGGMHGVWTYTC